MLTNILRKTNTSVLLNILLPLFECKNEVHQMKKHETPIIDKDQKYKKTMKPGYLACKSKKLLYSLVRI